MHVWSVDQQFVNAYVLWALTEADVRSGNIQRGASELRRELDQLEQVAEKSDDAYFIALSAATLLNVERTRSGERLLEKLKEKQADDGMLDGRTTITQSGGISRRVETTALAVLAFAKRSGKYAPQLRKAARWIIQNRQGGGGFGSTQATVLALKALVTYTRLSQSGMTADGKIDVVYGDEVIASAALPSNPSSASTIEITGIGQHLDPGNKEIQLVARGVTNLPFSVDVAYHTLTPPSDEACPLRIDTVLKSDGEPAVSTRAGETMEVTMTMENTTPEGLPMTVAVVGLPGGLEARAEQLTELRDAGEFDYFELRPREVILYWRTFKPEETRHVTFDVTAAIPGKYTGPASRAYLYYTAEQKFWTDPLEIEIGK